MNTTILTFWLCLSGTPCDAEHAAQINGKNSMSTAVIDGGVLYCDEVGALTNMTPAFAVLSKGLSFRHECQPGGVDL